MGKNNSNKKATKYLGMTRTMNCGMKATIIAYRGYDDIDVEFENGTIRKHMKTHYFRVGEIGLNRTGRRTDYIGQTRMMNCGMTATIITYRNNNDIDVQFENGNIRKHMKMISFKSGGIALESFDKIKTKCIGMTRTMNCGLKATIINYRNSNDIDVKFENGTISQHKCFNAFLKGQIKQSHIGETKTMNCGMKATIIEYRRCDDIDVKFEDGTICKHKRLSNFNRSSIPHPTGVLFNKYRMNGVAFRFHNTTYFYVTCVDDRKEIVEIMCIDDIKQKLQIH